MLDVMFATTRPWTAATTAVVAALAFAGLYLAVVGTTSGQVIDHELMRTISAAFGVENPVEGALGRYQLPMIAAGGLLVAAVVASRRSKTVAVSAALVLGSTVAGAYLLKALLERPSFGIGPELNSFPSNTVAVVAALAVILVGSAARRPVHFQRSSSTSTARVLRTSWPSRLERAPDQPVAGSGLSSWSLNGISMVNARQS